MLAFELQPPKPSPGGGKVCLMAIVWCALVLIFGTWYLWNTSCNQWVDPTRYVELWELSLDMPKNPVLIIGDTALDLWKDAVYCGASTSCSNTAIPGSTNIAVSGSTCTALSIAIPNVCASYGCHTRLNWAVIHCGTRDMEWSECGLFSVNGGGPVKAAESLNETIKQVLNITAVEDLGDRQTRVLVFGSIPYPGLEQLWESFSHFDTILKAETETAAALAKQANRWALPPVVVIDLFKSFHALEPREMVKLFAQGGKLLSEKGYALLTEFAQQVVNADTYDTQDCVIWQSGRCVMQAHDASERLPTWKVAQSQGQEEARQVLPLLENSLHG